MEKRILTDRTIMYFSFLFSSFFDSIHINVRLWFESRKRSESMKIIEVQLSNTPQSDYILSVPGVEGICVISGCRQKGFVKMLATTNLFYWALCKSHIYLLSKTKAEINSLWKTEKHFQIKMPISNFIFCIFTVIHCNTVKISFNRLK